MQSGNKKNEMGMGKQQANDMQNPNWKLIYSTFSELQSHIAGRNDLPFASVRWCAPFCKRLIDKLNKIYISSGKTEAKNTYFI